VGVAKAHATAVISNERSFVVTNSLRGGESTEERCSTARWHGRIAMFSGGMIKQSD
jgi:hypothetical protein